MPFPKQTLRIVDPGIGIVAASDDTPIITGIATGGSFAQNTLGSISDPTQVRSVIGYGPLAEDVALALSQRGGPIYFVIHNSADSKALSAVSLDKNGGSGPTVTVSGTPNDIYNLRVEIIAGGAVGTSTFRYSLDAFDKDAVPYTYSQIRPTVASFVIPNTGLTLAFPVGTYVANDAYSLTTVPKIPLTADLATVANLLISTPSFTAPLWLVSGVQATATGGAAFAAALGGHLTTLTQTYRYARAITDVGSDDTMANVKTQAALWTNSRITPGAGYVLRTSLLPFEGFSTRKTSESSGLGVRAMRELPSTDLARVASGPDEGVLKIYFDSLSDNSVDAVGISTMRTWPGRPGFYFTNAPLKSPFGSDFTDLQYGRLMDIACETTYAAQFPYIAASFRTQANGTIDPKDAKRVEARVSQALTDALLQPNNAEGTPGYVSAVTYAVDLNQNLVTSRQLKTSVAIRPLGYAKEIVTDLFFSLNA